MTKSIKLQSLVEEVAQPPASGTARRIYTKGRKVKMYANQIASQITDYVKSHRWGISDENAAELSGYYLSGELTDVGVHPINYLETRYKLSKETAANLWNELEKRFKHFRVFYSDNYEVDAIYVQGKHITPAEDGEDK